ncbi:MAG: hypothetical protein ABI851_12110 [Saprospiraceae bacterium]
MSNLIEPIIQYAESIIGKPGAVAVIQELKILVQKLSPDKYVDNPRMFDIDRRARDSDSPIIQGDKKTFKPFSFSPGDFEDPKPMPQSAPPADFEVRAQDKSVEVTQIEKERFDLFSLGQEKSEKSYPDLSDFAKKCKELGCEFKKAPKTHLEAWTAFEKYARKEMQI